MINSNSTHYPPPTRTELRKFGLLLGAIFWLIGFAPMRKHLDPRIWALATGSTLLFFTAAFPPGLAPIRRIWLMLGEVLGAINSRILLSFIFFFIVTPVGWIKRLFGADPLAYKTDARLETYGKARTSRKSEHFKFTF